MSNYAVKNKRIAKNTVMLYFRMVFLMAINLYTSRVILKTLGVEDYGIYNVVGGFVSTFAIVCNALSGGCSRFFNFEMGKGVENKLHQVFSASVTIHIGLSGIIILLAESFGMWFLNCKMTIPVERIVAANVCFQLSLLAFCVNLLQVPYRAAIIAHEDMSTFAYVSIFDGLARLAVAFLIVLSPYDTLIVYAIMLCVLQIIVNTIYIVYCRKHYPESKYRFTYDSSLFRPIIGYSGWNFLGHASAVLRNQGGNVLTNIFFGPVVNAARGIANQVMSAVEGFVNNFTMAVNPQISQSFAEGDIHYMRNLVYMSARFSYYLVFILSFPIILSTDFILKVWLDSPPEHSALFIQLMLIFQLINSINTPIQQASSATGNIRDYQLVVGISQLLIIPISYILLKNGGGPATVIYVSIIMCAISVYLRIYMLSRVIDWSILDYTKKVIIRVLLVTLVGTPIPLSISFICNSTWNSLIINTLMSTICILLAIWFVGLTSNERTFCIERIKRLTHN